MLTEIRKELAKMHKKVGRKTGPILIVEDDADDQLMLWREVKFQFGEVPVESFANGADLLKYLSKNRSEKDRKPRLILLDLHMPKMDGFGTLEKLRKDKALADIPVVVISGTHSDEEVIAAKDMGISAFMAKPYSRDQWVFF